MLDVIEKMINYVDLSQSIELARCLSVDKIVSDNKVYRYNKVKVKAMEFEGFDAIVVQHEIDHLKGILFTDYINNEFKNNPGNNPIPIE
uniref:peptide deformylase n=1 Tax=Biomphalaria glabrata TaxID=6526 RepID=A0A2C9M8J6_BIOGL